MKVKANVVEIDEEGLLALLGKRVVLMCLNYFYVGELVGVNDTCVKLKNGGIIYETGAFSEAKWKDFQPFGTSAADGFFYVSTGAIESFFETAK